MTSWSSVERAFIQRSGKKASYPNERAPVVEVLNVYELGKIVALSFLEWVHENPRGVIALPTGKTPEYFIKTLEHYKNNWSNPKIIEEVKSYGYAHSSFPDTTQLTFVMLDEFFPMLSTHRNSFCNYIQHFYIRLLNIKPENILNFDLIQNGVVSVADMNLFEGDVDLTLLTRAPTSDLETKQKDLLERVQKFCGEYEEKIKSLGGIGFFLGGIGPDGHIAFNQPGSAHDSPTRLVNFNYPSAAAAASDLGGIEKARGKAAMTIGLGSLKHNPNAKVIIMAAGEGKATVVKAAIEDVPSTDRPASALHSIVNARFFVTHGAAGKLAGRKQESISSLPEQEIFQFVVQHVAADLTARETYLSQPPLSYLLLESCLYDISLSLHKPLHLLTVADAQNAPSKGIYSLPDWLVGNALGFQLVCACASRRLKEKVEGGCKESSTRGMHILHTAPHHDDIMLSYHGAMHYMLGSRPAVYTDTLNSFHTSPHVSTAASTTTPSPATNPPAAPHTTIVERKLRSGSYSSYRENVLGEKYNENINHFAYLTSGFHSVNEDFIRAKVEQCLGPAGDAGGGAGGVAGGVGVDGGSSTLLEDIVRKGLLTLEYDDLMCEFHDAFHTKDFKMQDYIENVIFLRKVAEVYKITVTSNYNLLIADLKERMAYIQEEYLKKHVGGDVLPKDMQLLKGCMRETEVDRVWACSRMPMNRIHHLRSKFYTDDFFTPMPSLEDDALPVANLLRARQPDVLTVAFDPEGTGPDTHYKVLQVVAAGLRIALSRNDLDHPEQVLVWGYRNVWFTFSPSEATLLIPVSSPDLDLMHDTFMSCFTTQKTASFPSPHYDGPFSAWARQIQREQRAALGVLLGEEFFATHRMSRIRDAGGFIFIRAMPALQFLREVEELKSKFEVTA